MKYKSHYYRHSLSSWSTSIMKLIIISVVCYGYAANIYKLCQNDFESPYKAELIRCISIFVFPVGVVLGYITFDEEIKNDQ